MASLFRILIEVQTLKTCIKSGANTRGARTRATWVPSPALTLRYSDEPSSTAASSSFACCLAARRLNHFLRFSLICSE